MAAVNLLDLLILLLVGVSVYTGFRRGAALQIVTYTGLLIGLFVGALLAPRVAGLPDDPFLQASLALGILLLFAAIGDAIGWTIGRRVWVAARRSAIGPVDQGAGALVAVVAALLVAWFLAFNLVQGPFPTVSEQIRGSAIIRNIDRVLPRPPSLLAQARRFFDRFGFPEVFADLPPAPAGPVEGPSEAEAARAFEAVDQSTVKVLGRACGRILEGSGFLVEETHVVTNAHVVAGVQGPQVQQQDGGSFPATPVLFDPDLDLAVLRLDSAPAESVPLMEDAVDRGERGAVVGYPRGGDLTGVQAAVRRSLNALGRDIYGRDTVRRAVYELQAEVVPGNSGGPFVTTSGEVAGVVFAASTSDDGVGYAITSEEVLPRLRRAVDSPGPAGTGPCIP